MSNMYRFSYNMYEYVPILQKLDFCGLFSHYIDMNSIFLNIKKFRKVKRKIIRLYSDHDFLKKHYDSLIKVNLIYDKEKMRRNSYPALSVKENINNINNYLLNKKLQENLTVKNVKSKVNKI